MLQIILKTSKIVPLCGDIVHVKPLELLPVADDEADDEDDGVAGFEGLEGSFVTGLLVVGSGLFGDDDVFMVCFL